jgi:hypothetical protein
VVTGIFSSKFTVAGAGLLVVGLAAASARAETACGLCNTEIVTNSELAGCFLDDYQNLASKDGAVIVVDLSGCEISRGGLEALPSPTQTGPALEPDLQFMLSRVQLDCLKQKLEQPGLVLDPSARIELAGCG